MNDEILITCSLAKCQVFIESPVWIKTFARWYWILCWRWFCGDRNGLWIVLHFFFPGCYLSHLLMSYWYLIHRKLNSWDNTRSELFNRIQTKIMSASSSGAGAGKGQCRELYAWLEKTYLLLLYLLATSMLFDNINAVYFAIASNSYCTGDFVGSLSQYFHPFSSAAHRIWKKMQTDWSVTSFLGCVANPPKHTIPLRNSSSPSLGCGII